MARHGCVLRGCGTVVGMTVLALAQTAHAGQASGYFRIGDLRLDMRHAMAVAEEPSDAPEDKRIFVYLSDAPLDAVKVASTFDADDAVREQAAGRPGGYLRICINADGSECGLFFSPDGFNSGGYCELKLDKFQATQVAGSWVLAEPEEFFDKTYEFNLRFDTGITPAPGQPLPAGGGEPGTAYNAWLAALARGDLEALRRMGGEGGGSRFPVDEPTAAKEALKSLRDGQPLRAEISRGRLDGVQAILWVEGVDRDDIQRRGRVLMQRTPEGWRYVESDLDSVDE